MHECDKYFSDFSIDVFSPPVLWWPSDRLHNTT